MKSVTIILDEDNQQEWRDVRCVNCGRKLCNVNRLIASIITDAGVGQHMIENLDKPAVEVKCRGCEGIYTLLIQ